MKFSSHDLKKKLEEAGVEPATGLGILRGAVNRRLKRENHGTLPTWSRAWDALPKCNCRWDLESVAVVVKPSRKAVEFDPVALRQDLQQFHPWRKGPFEILGCRIDTEWRSNWKWDRLAGAVDFRSRAVLDIGCGNGYYGWRMLGAGADWVLGCDPFLLYEMQFEVLRRYATEDLRSRHFVLPIGDEEIPDGLNYFDITLSMGVLYHRTSPIDHLRKIASTLKPNGQVVMETIVVDSAEPTVLVPEGRYAKMRNVWFLPSVPMLELWMSRTGFCEIEVVDVSLTTTEEQRRTEWMTFESLADFLDPNDASKTIEGYPAPRRALLVARKKT
ncbi:MAG: tRNA 5-methoxyuridine(34)/uridine 5-oxyacetic acid(34) synthase CmoB [Planctomycetota bacterium]|nr:tRNA 5-methoxyuridine(34)/uridine 5-oxyacetic acid(34) synthase CmoB [Planctomycetota bacterium]